MHLDIEGLNWVRADKKKEEEEEEGAHRYR